MKFATLAAIAIWASSVVAVTYQTSSSSVHHSTTHHKSSSTGDARLLASLATKTTSKPKVTVKSTKTTSKSSTPSVKSAGTVGKLEQNNKWVTGVAAMHAILVNPRKILIIDKAENNPAKFDDGSSAWTSYYDLDLNQYYALSLKTNSFCSGGGFLANGTFVSTGGSGSVGGDWGKGSNGFQTIREFDPCNADSFQTQTCNWREFSTGALTSNRWYPTAAQLPEGNIIIVGGCNASLAVNTPKDNIATYEFWPPNGGATNLPFLVETLPYNLYPVVHVLPDGNLFLFANRMSIVFNYKSNKVVYSLPDIPGNPRSYPLTASSVLLPLSSSNNYTAEVLICGGSTKMNKKSQGDNTCGRIVVRRKTSWVMETMSSARIMSDMVLQADGKVFISNGCRVGMAGYASRSSKDGPYTPKCSDPVLTPSIYDPAAPVGKRFTNNLPSSKIPRMYHSVSLMIPDGRIWIAGSNPVDPAQTAGVPFPTEYRVEYFSPPYLLSGSRPTITKVPKSVKHGATFTLTVDLHGVKPKIKVAIVNGGFVTHSTHMSQRYLVLDSSLKGTTLTIHAPPNTNLFPPGPGFLYVLNNEVPAIAPMITIT